MHVDQRRPPGVDGLFESLGEYSFEAGTQARITIQTADTEGVVIADSVRLLSHDADDAREPIAADATTEADVDHPSNESTSSTARR
ncbi:MAG: hypothetical protein R3C05_14315 [Pirellulaceae bacterium]